MSLFLTAFCIPLTGLPTQTARTVCKSNVLLKAEFLLYERVSLMTAIQGQGRVCFPVKEKFHEYTLRSFAFCFPSQQCSGSLSLASCKST